MEWQGLTILRSIPSICRKPTFRPLASTTRRAEIISSLDSVTFCRSVAVEIDTALAMMVSTSRGISALIALTSAS
jgi:hypothetical protein